MYYDSQEHVYFADTLPDATGGHWTLSLLESDKLDQATLKQLTEQYKGRSIVIVYTGSLETDDEIEIISSEFVKDADTYAN
ncbi:hypothetical protein FPZ49_11215 [Paenibacillus cremeus]|uniref:Uncharacterized protein n=1 Tax=Paenibacillus cremeus TaxID=2163881 RepID=A0A559KCU6_9BACL|nr:hypothetical protein FPZ49_11215 [Paenibacillus cremeus]